LGVLAWGRLSKVVGAAIKHADPDGARARAHRSVKERFVSVRPDVGDELSSWVTVRVDTRDAVLFEDTVTVLARRLHDDGDTRSLDQRRAAVYGLLANPAAAVQRFGIFTTAGMADPSAMRVRGAGDPGCRNAHGAIVHTAHPAVRARIP